MSSEEAERSEVVRGSLPSEKTERSELARGEAYAFGNEAERSELAREGSVCVLRRCGTLRIRPGGYSF